MGQRSVGSGGGEGGSTFFWIWVLEQPENCGICRGRGGERKGGEEKYLLRIVVCSNLAAVEVAVISSLVDLQ